MNAYGFINVPELRQNGFYVGSHVNSLPSDAKEVLMLTACVATPARGGTFGNGETRSASLHRPLNADSFLCGATNLHRPVTLALLDALRAPS
jgi:hypothetical protein